MSVRARVSRSTDGWDDDGSDSWNDANDDDDGWESATTIRSPPSRSMMPPAPPLPQPP